MLWWVNIFVCESDPMASHAKQYNHRRGGSELSWHSRHRVLRRLSLGSPPAKPKSTDHLPARYEEEEEDVPMAPRVGEGVRGEGGHCTLEPALNRHQ